MTPNNLPFPQDQNPASNPIRKPIPAPQPDPSNQVPIPSGNGQVDDQKGPQNSEPTNPPNEPEFVTRLGHTQHRVCRHSIHSLVFLYVCMYVRSTYVSVHV